MVSSAVEKADAARKDVWVPDATQGYVAAYVVSEDGTDSVVCLPNGQVRTVPTSTLSAMNPAKFDKVADIADLTFLNEASVVHNLRQRYFSDLIYVRRRSAHADLLGPLLGRGEPVPCAADLHRGHY